MVSQLVHVWVVLSHDSDGVTLLANDQPSLLLRGVPQVDAIELKWEEKVSKSPFIPKVHYEKLMKVKNGFKVQEFHRSKTGNETKTNPTLDRT